MTTKTTTTHFATQFSVLKPRSIVDLKNLEDEKQRQEEETQDLLLLSNDNQHVVVDQNANNNDDVDNIQNQPCRNVQPVSPYASSNKFTNVCSSKGGSQVLFATDEWFATADNLLQDGPPIFVDDLYCEEGKVMDGWETRRRREAGHDFCIIKLSERCQEIQALELDTAHFTGNHVPHISIQVADLSIQEEQSMVMGMPGVLERLLNKGKGIQGTGHTPQEVEQAEEACRQVEWKDLLPYTALNPGYENSRMHSFDVSSGTLLLSNMSGATHVRVNYYPDGGVARMRLWAPSAESLSSEHCQVAPVYKKKLYAPITTGKVCTVVAHSSQEIMPSRQDYEFPELSCDQQGGKGLACSNKHYGEPRQLIQPTLGKDMGDGWETARHPERPSILVKDPQTNLVDSDLMDWAILKLGSVALDGIHRIILDTKHFRGNYPESVCVEGCYAERGMTDDMVVCTEVGPQWFPLIHRTRMAPDSEHVFDRPLAQIANATRAITHVRVSIFPDGGISRVRIYGQGMDDTENIMRSNM
eukprot:CAMPEP_0195284072 /NCGR_PEP_ID=MMETSP0707-20130614/2410_1 /TAXON_ID=33640 /ORGANISM="Asterionellopsis glacialis, Strain CCMP134" /LENGTH=527 /DNA_ID=CAMNT_0040343367 /DNA_START=134 /DNA_END=1717 /DNA_ORIENTATION=-